MLEKAAGNVLRDAVAFGAAPQDEGGAVSCFFPFFRSFAVNPLKKLDSGATFPHFFAFFRVFSASFRAFSA
ncbi:MAG TPA: hypothetical protein VMI72_14390 [Roseiarcus sp.]|nr:hypothetical protein [Roseiarcus sp.]